MRVGEALWGGVFEQGTFRTTYHKNTRCTNCAQEERSALPCGVINVNEDVDDDGDFYGGGRGGAEHLA